MPPGQAEPLALRSVTPVRPAAIVLTATALMAVGLVMVASTSASLDHSLLSARVFRTPFGRQCLFMAIGLLLMPPAMWVGQAVLARPDLCRRLAWTVYVGVAMLLVAALIPGVASAHRGSQRWLSVALGGTVVGFQPSELAKPALVLLLAFLLADRGAEPRSFLRGFLPATAAIALFVGLVGKEDFGTCVLLAAVSGSMLLVGGCKMRHLGIMAILGAIGMCALVLLERYRVQRIATYWDFWSDPQGHGYQPLQSLTTIATGGWFGAGLGAGIQKYGYLPESHTDFIFAVICEEMGVFGGILVMALFAVFVWLGLRTMLAAATPCERLLAFGLTLTVGLQAAMNIAVVTVLTPTTGISLPFISAGGSGLLTFCMTTGLLAAIAARSMVAHPAEQAARPAAGSSDHANPSGRVARPIGASGSPMIG